jgi:hypothetical protein
MLGPLPVGQESGDRCKCLCILPAGSNGAEEGLHVLGHCAVVLRRGLGWCKCLCILSALRYSRQSPNSRACNSAPTAGPAAFTQPSKHDFSSKKHAEHTIRQQDAAQLLSRPSKAIVSQTATVGRKSCKRWLLVTSRCRSEHYCLLEAETSCPLGCCCCCSVGQPSQQRSSVPCCLHACLQLTTQIISAVLAGS